MANRSDWFRKETADDSFEPTIDMLLKSTFFVWFGVVCPWDLFASSIVSLWRLVVLAIVILLLRRPVVLLLLQRFFRQIDGIKDATFVGFFGPIGVSALFYQHLTLEFLQRENHASDGSLRGDVKVKSETVKVTIWFIVLCSIVSALHAL
jgi:NhaP-type Na+/H+ or K+/H+ antiporter